MLLFNLTTNVHVVLVGKGGSEKLLSIMRAVANSSSPTLEDAVLPGDLSS